jgi:hypothetical protein
MMRKTAVALCGVFIFGAVAFAGEGKFGHKHKYGDCKGDKENKVAMKKEKMEYFKNLETLIEKHNNTADKDKNAVKEEIKVLVSNQTDKDITARKEMLEHKKAKLAEFENKINYMENEKDKYVNEKVDFFISPEGQEKMKDMQKRKKEHKKQSGKSEHKKKKSK